MADRTAGRNGLGRRDDGIGIDAVMPVELGERSGLAEVLDAKRAHAMAGNGAKPCECRWVAVEHGDDPAMRRHVAKQPLDVRACALLASSTSARPDRSPSSTGITASMPMPPSRRLRPLRPA